VAALRASGLASRCAIVVGPKAHQFGLARMAQAHLESREMEVRIFRDLDKALTWVAPPRPE
jgi:alcohol dehydrogenase class IV